MSLQAIDAARHFAGKANELQALRDRVQELEELLGIHDSVDFRLLGFSPSEAKLLGVLMNRTIASYETLFVGIWGGRSEVDQPEIKLIHVLMCKIRKKLAALNVRIVNQRSCGWLITESDKAILRQHLRTRVA